MAQALYALMRLAPRRRKIVLFSRQADSPPRDFLMLVEEIESRDASIEIVVRCRRIPGGFFGRVVYLGEVLAQMAHLATATVCVVDGYCIPVSLLDHGDGLRVVQIWHALVAFKRIGLQAVGVRGGRDASLARAMRMHRNYDRVLCGGPAAIPAYAEAFGVPEDHVLPLGLPRVDHLLRMSQEANRAEATAALRRRLPGLSHGSGLTVLYAPTFRADGTSAMDRVVQAFAGTPHTLVLKPHHARPSGLEADTVVDATGIDVTDLLPACDVVITDYSGVACEASVLGLPVYFYVYDHDDFALEPGLNVDPLSEFPTMSSTGISDIVAKITERHFSANVTQSLNERFAVVRDGTCTERIATCILDLMPNKRVQDA